MFSKIRDVFISLSVFLNTFFINKQRGFLVIFWNNDKPFFEKDPNIHDLLF